VHADLGTAVINIAYKHVAKTVITTTMTDCNTANHNSIVEGFVVRPAMPRPNKAQTSINDKNIDSKNWNGTKLLIPINTLFPIPFQLGRKLFLTRRVLT
jgi:hypothetical protein